MLFNPADAEWRVTPRAIFSLTQKDWLSRGGALTSHLAHLGKVDVQVLREAVELGWVDEIPCLKVNARTLLWVREVLLRVNGMPFVAARSAVPLAASHGVWRALRGLHTQPLSTLLYHDKSIKRSALVSRRLNRCHPLYRLACRNVPEIKSEPTLSARRSIFVRLGVPLLVTECMLNTLWTHLASESLYTLCNEECRPRQRNTARRHDIATEGYAEVN